MVTSVLVRDNRPEAVSSAHWGDISTTSFEAAFEAAFLKATLKLLAIIIPARAFQDNPPGSLTFTSMDAEITKSQPDTSTHEETSI